MKHILQKLLVGTIVLFMAIPSFAQFPPGGQGGNRPGGMPGGQRGPGGERFKEMMSKVVMDNIANRKSVRSFSGVVVTKDTLKMLVKAGMAAPTAMNKQPWQFYATNDAKIIANAQEKLGRHGAMVAEAGAVIVVCGDPAQSEMFWMIDASCAAENILLAIESMGLGGVWLSAYPNEERMNSINEAFGIPSEYKVLCIIPVGHPAKQEKAKDKWDKKKFHFNKW